MNSGSDATGQLLTDRVFRLLRDEIISGAPKPGEPFNEGVMAKRLKASRTPIREACNRLRNAGLLVAMPNKGYMVAPITVKDVLNVYQLRLVVEPVCAEHAARNLSGEELDELERLLEPERKHPENEPHLALIDLNKAFHLFLAETTNNDRILSLIDSLLLAAARMDYAFIDLYPAAWTGHAEIISALKARSPADARQAMYRHIQLSQQRMSRIFSTDQLPPWTVSLERSAAVLK
jgi:GntR family transcriptional regulator, rspAB operon transcriptional repressor